MKTRSNQVLNARPHPGPLPQERENHSPASCVAKSSFNSSGSRFELPIHESSQFDFRTTGSTRLLSPLPGGEGQGEGERNN
jgi:hypothetical protein